MDSLQEPVLQYHGKMSSKNTAIITVEQLEEWEKYFTSLTLAVGMSLAETGQDSLTSAFDRLLRDESKREALLIKKIAAIKITTGNFALHIVKSDISY